MIYGYLSKPRSSAVYGWHENVRHCRPFHRPGRNGGIPPWAGDFRPAVDSPRIKNPIGKTLALEMPDGRSGKVVVQRLKGGSKNTVLALLGEGLAPF